MFGEMVTVFPRVQTGEDRFGNPTYEWPGPGNKISGCAVAYRTTDEPTMIARNAVYEGITIYAPPGTFVGPHDRLGVRGVLYEVDGDARDWRSPYQPQYLSYRGVVIFAKRVEG